MFDARSASEPSLPSNPARRIRSCGRISFKELATVFTYLDTARRDRHENLNAVKAPLASLSDEELCPGSVVLAKINAARQ